MFDQYQRLDADAVAKTLQQLHARISARFPTRNIANVALALGEPVASAQSRVDTSTQRAVRGLCRAGIGVVVALAVIAVWLSVRDAVDAAEGTRAFEWLPIIESGINDVVFAGIAVYFLSSLPGRLQRRRTLDQLHRLRSLAHVIDMHQLAKDPERVFSSLEPTDVSLPADLVGDELGKYLSYCGELLAMVGKTAALHAEESNDPVVLDTVSEIENLTSGISREIWQKITLLRTGA
jgi:hypothetical protein